MTMSAAEGPTTVPLLDETIPQNLARTVAEHGERDALVSVEQGPALHVRRVLRGDRPGWPGGSWP